MKIVIMSDIHGSYYFLKKGLEKFEEEKGDRLLILGDELYHGPRNELPKEYNPKEVLKLLNQYKDKIIAVRGNCDSEVDQMVLEYPIMSDYVLLDIDDLRIFATHGHIYNPDNLPKLNSINVFLYGHTHIQRCEKKDNLYILNPGSISIPKNNNKNSYGVIENRIFYIKDFDGNIIDKIELEVQREVLL